MNTIRIEIDKCDKLANSYYNLDESGKRRAAGDWLEQVRKTAKMINNRSNKPIMNVQNGFLDSTLC